ncbi:MAG TPA: HEAT repeat domain-containing protein [Candidatus Melainabacteria bacterium]|nr:HEAT repeat domain-containing protein [Candidatus Melainabacteria bacterium]
MTKKTDTHLKAGSLNTAPVELESLAKSEQEKVRKRVASNQACKVDTLMMLAVDASKEVRRSVALNPAASCTTLVKLSYDSSPDVRFALAESVRTPMAILRRLKADDPNPYVRQRAEETIKGIEEFLLEVRQNHHALCFQDHLAN